MCCAGEDRLRHCPDAAVLFLAVNDQLFLCLCVACRGLEQFADGAVQNVPVFCACLQNGRLRNGNCLGFRLGVVDYVILYQDLSGERCYTDLCAAVFHLYRLTADNVYQRRHVCAEAELAGAVLQV